MKLCKTLCGAPALLVAGYQITFFTMAFVLADDLVGCVGTYGVAHTLRYCFSFVTQNWRGLLAPISIDRADA